MDGNFIKEWESLSELSSSFKTINRIISCCKNRLESYKNYKWSYKINI